mmetsp:Transcript_1498/g.2248  ORF Transcript_1498/g.2248 Transcript_1498/m.2248 type:complete len:219 (-) Transcript_1498:152-808(-)
MRFASVSNMTVCDLYLINQNGMLNSNTVVYIAGIHIAYIVVYVVVMDIIKNVVNAITPTICTIYDIGNTNMFMYFLGPKKMIHVIHTIDPITAAAHASVMFTAPTHMCFMFKYSLYIIIDTIDDIIKYAINSGNVINDINMSPKLTIFLYHGIFSISSSPVIWYASFFSIFFSSSLIFSSFFLSIVFSSSSATSSKNMLFKSSCFFSSSFFFFWNQWR